MSRPYDQDAPVDRIEHPRVLRLPPERVHSPYRFHFNENARALIELQHLVAELTTRVEALEKR